MIRQTKITRRDSCPWLSSPHDNRSEIRHETPLPCGKVCGCEGRPSESSGTDRLVGMSLRCLKVPKAMFLSWLTLVWNGRGRTACESVLSSLNVRFAHNPKGCNPH